jgi:hypothetical protein
LRAGGVSETARLKDKNVPREKRVALSITDPDNPYRYLAILGEVEDVTQNECR